MTRVWKRLSQGKYDLAWNELRPLAEDGHAAAQHLIGVMYYFGRGTAVNHTEAVKWYRRAADQEFPSAQNNLGNMYMVGEGVEQDHAEALKLFLRATDHGVFNAMYSVSYIYAEGVGIERDPIESLKWLYILVMSIPTGVDYPKDAETRNAPKTSAVLESRDYVASQMSFVQIAKSQQLAYQWLY